jgi:hypothetical protein
VNAHHFVVAAARSEPGAGVTTSCHLFAPMSRCPREKCLECFEFQEICDTSADLHHNIFIAVR